MSQRFQPADAANSDTTADFGSTADWKSAIQQVGNLRYARTSIRTETWTDFVTGPDGDIMAMVATPAIC